MADDLVSSFQLDFQIVGVSHSQLHSVDELAAIGRQGQISPIDHPIIDNQSQLAFLDRLGEIVYRPYLEGCQIAG
ncbi:MAG: hypothetical protein Q7O66_02475 [Dehalococcoidia bacterium]|nr:hypothetical protein [Dehalococcoidia bacterium]